ncbi:leucyl aminopeptidase [Paenibacillus pasadenensis]|uniref:leucyl aminopeptidase n=1 Tax=Paenibacillus pasadenensis TaxID=217090 RepID=UPI00204003D9|nr:leucyl aminopeptidase [Paenibacillus pasadenensis]MCM3749885.1 leucyl aminopeptidase [Paenibacillus pasadenensis]
MKITFTDTIQEQSQPWELLVRPVTAAELGQESASEKLDAADPLALPAVKEAMQERYRRGSFKASPEQTLSIPLLGLLPNSTAAFIGLGGGAVSADDLRRLGAAAAREVRSQKAASACLLLPTALYAGIGGIETGDAAAALAEGLVLGAYERSKTISEESKKVHAAELQCQLCGEPTEEQTAIWNEGFKRGVTAGEAVVWARDLVHLPGSVLTPEALAEEAEQLAADYDLDCEIIDEWTAQEQGMGGLLAVGKGSVHPPRMIVLHYEGDPDSEEKWGLVGKGITFDTGGYSLKRAPGMEEMIGDMGGAAAVLAAMRIIGSLKLKANVVAVIPSAENMISERAYKPGDVITMMNGLTVEIVNTDAEGRLVLADGMTTALKRGATKLVDVATLTGGVVGALGEVASGIMSNDETFRQQLEEAALRTGERVWPLPAFKEYRRQLDSDAADLKNGAGREGAASIAGMFISAFVGEKPWLHIDIAGTSWISRARGWEGKGATGVMARTLAELVRRG